MLFTTVLPHQGGLALRLMARFNAPVSTPENCNYLVSARCSGQLFLEIQNLLELGQEPAVDLREVENLFDGEVST